MWRDEAVAAICPRLSRMVFVMVSRRFIFHSRKAPPTPPCAAGVGARTGVRLGRTGAARARWRRCRAIASGDDRSIRRCRAISSGDRGSSRQCRAISSGDDGSCRRCRAISSGDDGSSRRTARSGAAAAARGVRAVTRHHAGHSGAGSPSPH